MNFKRLSGLEQVLYFKLEEKDQKAFDIKDVTRILNISLAHARKLACDMVKKGACERVKPGLYVKIPQTIILRKGKYIEDPILVGSIITKPYFFSYYTALNIHGIEQRYTKEIYITSIKHQKDITYHGCRLRFVRVIPKRFFGFKNIDYMHHKIAVASIERTIIDIFDRPEYAGGWQEIISCLLDLEAVNWGKLLEYIEIFNEKIMVHRMGYIFEKLQSAVNVPEQFIRALKKRTSKNTYYFDEKKLGKYSGTWRIVVPEKITEAVENA